jgi:hypothetical protein
LKRRIGEPSRERFHLPLFADAEILVRAISERRIRNSLPGRR